MRAELPWCPEACTDRRCRIGTCGDCPHAITQRGSLINAKETNDHPVADLCDTVAAIGLWVVLYALCALVLVQGWRAM